jgi:GH25 family lysozyme M1 (1,4-beta-N-acetylmuramidase)
MNSHCQPSSPTPVMFSKSPEIGDPMMATKWQQYSVRGFLAGVVRKRLGLNLVSEQTDKGRVYRIKDGNAAPASADRAKQAA